MYLFKNGNHSMEQFLVFQINWKFSKAREWQINWNWSNQNMQQLKRTVFFYFFVYLLVFFFNLFKCRITSLFQIFFSFFFGLAKEFLNFVEFSSFPFCCLLIVRCFYSFIQKIVFRSFQWSHNKKKQQNTRGIKFRSFVQGIKSFLWHKNLIEINSNFLFVFFFLVCERRNWKKYIK